MDREVRALAGIRAVSFDVDGTLWDFDMVMRRSLQETLLELGRLRPEGAAGLTVERVIEIRDRVYEERRGSVTDLIAIRREGFREALRVTSGGSNDEELASHLTDVYLHHRYAQEVPFEDVAPTLEALRGRYKLGVLSNGNSYPKQLGLEDVISFGVFSQDHGGVEKPDPRLFQIAIEEAGCSPGEFVHVGDSLESDVNGARNAGVRSVWINRNGDENGAGVEADAEISSLRELLVLL